VTFQNASMILALPTERDPMSAPHPPLLEFRGGLANMQAYVWYVISRVLCLLTLVALAELLQPFRKSKPFRRRHQIGPGECIRARAMGAVVCYCPT
jgi:hypothetical protein